MPGEIVKARKTLKELRDEILEAVKERSIIQDRTEAMKAECGQLEKSIIDKNSERSQIDSEIQKKKQELGILEGVSNNKRLAVISIDATRELSSAGLSEIEHQISNLLDQVAGLEFERTSIERDSAGKQILRDRVSVDVRKLVGDKVSLEHAVAQLVSEVTQARDTKDNVLGAIDDALKNFRIFERRIGSFSRETGYTVGYTSPSSLSDSK